MELIGQTILNYKILSQIGEGGMGQVYLAEHIVLGRKVAVKVLLQEYAQNYEIKSRFINEAKILSKLSNRYIVSLLDFAEIDNNLFLIMEFIEGVSLNEYISKTEDVNVPLTLNIFKQILDGFEYAHNQGIIHRDIKPSNIILQKDNTPKILDFGIAKIVQGDIKLTRTGVKMGSVLYMSPEQILGEEVDIRTDIYSLGILLYEMLTLKIPYDIKTDSDYKVMDKILKQEIPLININSNDEIGRIIQKACQKNKEDRYQSLTEFKNELNSVPLASQESETNVSNVTQIINNNIPDTSTSLFNNNLQSKPLLNKDNAGRKAIYVSSGLIIGGLLIIFLIFNRYNNSAEDVVSKTLVKEANVYIETNTTRTVKDRLITLLKLSEQKTNVVRDYSVPSIYYINNNTTSVKDKMRDKPRKKYNFKSVDDLWAIETVKLKDGTVITDTDANNLVKMGNYAGVTITPEQIKNLTRKQLDNVWNLTAKNVDAKNEALKFTINNIY